MSASELLDQLINRWLDDGNELRWRVMGVPNPMFENEAGECRHAPEGCSWRCPSRTGGDFPGQDKLREYVARRVGASLFAVLDGYGDDISEVTLTAPEVDGDA